MRLSVFVVAMALVSGCASDPCAPGTASVTIPAVEQVDNFARVTLTYGGGCAPHRFEFRWDGLTAASNPGKVGLQVHHYTDDECDALVTEELWLDLAELEGTVGSRTWVFFHGRDGAPPLAQLLYTGVASAPPPDGVSVVALERACLAF